MKKVKEEVGVEIITDIHESWQAKPVGEIVDVIQIPAFLCRQTDLLKAAAETGKIIQVKKGQMCSADQMHKCKEKIIAFGNPNVILCERGNSFGYQDLVVDPRNLIWLKSETNKVCMDITHCLQQPSQKMADGTVKSGGYRDLIPYMGKLAIALEVDSIFMECHDNPEKALCDGPTQWPLDKLEWLLDFLDIEKKNNQIEKPLLPIMRREILGDICEKFKFKVGIEIGVQYGLFSKEILKRWKSCEKYYLIDIWDSINDDTYNDSANVGIQKQAKIYQKCLENLGEFKNKISVIKMTSDNAVNLFDDFSIDFIYIDARHDYSSVHNDLKLYYPKLKKNGIFSGDDYIDADDQDKLRESINKPKDNWRVQNDGSIRKDNKAVKSAVNEFTQNINKKLQICYNDTKSRPIAPIWPTWYFQK